MKFSYPILIGIVMIFAVSCGAATVDPVIPDSNASQQITSDVPANVILTESILDYLVIEKVIIRNAASFEYGTDMSADELRQYYAVMVTEAMFDPAIYTGPFWDYVRSYFYCEAGIYESYPTIFIGNIGLIGAMGLMSDDEIFALVEQIEMYEDVPNGPPPDGYC